MGTTAEHDHDLLNSCHSLLDMLNSGHGLLGMLNSGHGLLGMLSSGLKAGLCFMWFHVLQVANDHVWLALPDNRPRRSNRLGAGTAPLENLQPKA